jgi:acetyl-CoA synthetase
MNESNQQPLERVMDLIARYSSPQAAAGWLLCDQHDPDAVAYTLVAQDLSAQDISYGMLRADSERLADSLVELGVRPGDRIATLMGKSRAYLTILMAIWRLGAVHVPLFTAFATPAVTFRLIDSNSKWVVCDSVQRPKLGSEGSLPWRIITTGPADAQALSFSDVLNRGHPGFGAVAAGGAAALIHIYTSGTTGQPKGVVVPLRALASFQTYAEYALALRSDDVFWNAADPGWAYGLYLGVLVTLLTGTRGILFEGGFSPEATLTILSRYGVTNLAAAPTVFRSLRASGLSIPGDLRLRCISSAGEPLTPDVSEWSTSALSVPVHDHYGQTETAMLINNHHHALLRRSLKPGSMGCPMPGWHAVVLLPDRNEPAAPGQSGRVAMDLHRSPLAWFGGYTGQEAHTAEKFSADGRWYFTGDSGYVDEDGDFFFCGRDDDVILMAGYRIGPVEVESVLLMHAAVSECAVVAIPDPIRGEVLEAVVVLRAGHAATDELSRELQEWVKRRYAAHAYPRRIHYAGSLPKTPSGKVQRFVLRRQLRDPGS